MTDRHYSLFANNQHPIQLAAYEEYNNFLARMHDAAEAQNDAVIAAEFEDAANKKLAKLNTKEGESLSLDDLQDLYIDVQGRARERMNMSLNTRTRTGDINDYLETRRPFGAGQQ